MIVIKVEMWPGGDESKAEEFSRAYIDNRVVTTLRTGGTHGDYHAKFMGGIWGRPDCARRIWKTSTVSGFNRTTRGVWDLIYLALKAAVGTRNL